MLQYFQSQDQVERVVWVWQTIYASLTGITRAKLSATQQGDSVNIQPHYLHAWHGLAQPIRDKPLGTTDVENVSRVHRLHHVLYDLEKARQ